MKKWHSASLPTERLGEFGVDSTALPSSPSESEGLAFDEARRWRMDLLEQIESEIERLQAERDKFRKEVAALDSLLGYDTDVLSVAIADAEGNIQPQTDGLTEPYFSNDSIREPWHSPALSESVEATVSVLRQRGRPLHYREIYTKVVNMGVHVPGKDPAATLLSRFIRDPRIERVASGTYKALPDIVADESRSSESTECGVQN